MQAFNPALMVILGATTAVFLTTTQVAYAEEQTTAGTSQLTISSQLEDGTPIEGKFTELASGDTILSTGFTPATFTLDNGEEYLIGVADYLHYFFDHWLDTGSADRWRPVTITEDTDLVAVYRIEVAEASDVGDVSTADNSPAFDFRYMLELVDRLAVYQGDNSNVPDLDLNGYVLPGGSQVSYYGCLYELASYGVNLTNVMRAVELAGLDWNGLTEEQQCYLALVLNLGIPLDDNGLPL